MQLATNNINYFESQNHTAKNSFPLVIYSSCAMFPTTSHYVSTCYDE